MGVPFTISYSRFLSWVPAVSFPECLYFSKSVVLYCSLFPFVLFFIRVAGSHPDPFLGSGSLSTSVFISIAPGSVSFRFLGLYPYYVCGGSSSLLTF